MEKYLNLETSHDVQLVAIFMQFSQNGEQAEQTYWLLSKYPSEQGHVLLSKDISFRFAPEGHVVQNEAVAIHVAHR